MQSDAYVDELFQIKWNQMKIVSLREMDSCDIFGIHRNLFCRRGTDVVLEKDYQERIRLLEEVRINSS